MNDKDIIKHNEKAWDHSVAEGNTWTVIADEESVKNARNGHPRIILSPHTPVPSHWLGNLKTKQVLGLAAAGGQQSALLAAAGADVTIVDLSGQQLEQDKKAAEKYGHDVRTIQSNAEDLGALESNAFDLIVNPTSNCFFPKLDPVWSECHRVLRPGGRLMYAFLNPISYLFDFEKANRGEFHLKYAQPFSDIESFDDDEKERFLRPESPLEFGHSLNTQLQTLLRKGFVIIDMFEDYWGPQFQEPIDKFFPAYINILAEKKS